MSETEVNTEEARKIDRIKREARTPAEEVRVHNKNRPPGTDPIRADQVAPW